MGMFDYVKVNPAKLPLNEDEKKLLGGLFQTKDFDCILTEIRITDNDQLEIDRFEYAWDKNASSAIMGEKGGGLVHKNQRTEIIPLHGYFNFYGHNKRDEWIEFVAKFTDGKMVSIERVPEV
jgi:hypothetical protein